ncbi:hypothetical protein AAXE64_08070 [Priestia megaterium]
MNKQLDKDIIERVLGLSFTEDNLGFWVRLSEYEDATLFRPSSNMNDAWVVAEKLNEYGDFSLYKDCDDSKWKAELAISNIELYGASDESAPVAICKVAMNSV